jgi:hypothetical protein
VSFRKNWFPSLVISALQLLAGGLIYKQQVQPWVENLLSQPWDRILRVAGYILGLSALLFGLLRARALWPWVRNVVARRRNREIVLPLSGSSVSTTISKAAVTASVSSPDLPPGTASAIAMAMQPPPQRSQLGQFVNTSMMQQWEAYQRHHDLQTRFAIDSTMPRFNAALLSPPSAPPSFVLH